MKKLYSAIVMICALSTSVLSQSSDEEKGRQIGLTYSSLSGSGIHYIVKLDSTNNFKFTGIYIYQDENSSRDSFFSFGIEYQKNLEEKDDRRIYVLGGFGFDNNVSSVAFFGGNRNDSFVSLGTGIGIDLGESKRGIVFNGHITYQYTRGFGDSDRIRLGLGVGIGAGFNF